MVVAVGYGCLGLAEQRRYRRINALYCTAESDRCIFIRARYKDGVNYLVRILVGREMYY